MKAKLLLVWWLDAETEVGWDGPDDFDHDGRPVFSQGFEIKRTAERLYLGADWDAHNENFNRVISIPVPWIVSELTLGELSTDLSEGRHELKCRLPKKKVLSF